VDELRESILKLRKAERPVPQELAAAKARLQPDDEDEADELGPLIEPAALTSSGDSPLQGPMPPRRRHSCGATLASPTSSSPW
jgi:hypothetical protein